MLRIIALLLLLNLQAQLALSLPLFDSGPLHPCRIEVQRWVGNTFTIQPYGTSSQNLFDFSVHSLTGGQSYTIPTPIGSHTFTITDTADPAVSTGVGGRDFNDPGKLSFTWATQTWNTYVEASPCVVKAVGLPNGLYGMPDTYTCGFQCDA